MSETKEMTVSEAGAIGGRRVKERYGSEFYREIGKKGGNKTAEKGSDYFASIGSAGGNKTVETHGREFYRGIGKKGGNRVKELIAAGKAAQAGR